MCTIIFNPKKGDGINSSSFRKGHGPHNPWPSGSFGTHCRGHFLWFNVFFFPGRSGSAITTIPVAIEYGIFQQAQEETTPKIFQVCIQNLILRIFYVSIFMIFLITWLSHRVYQHRDYHRDFARPSAFQRQASGDIRWSSSTEKLQTNQDFSRLRLPETNSKFTPFSNREKN